MQHGSTAEDYDARLRRVVDRLRSMPLNKLHTAEPVVSELARALLKGARTLGSPAPAVVPELSPWAYGDMIMVLGNDVREQSSHESDLEDALAALAWAQRQLP